MSFCNPARSYNTNACLLRRINARHFLIFLKRVESVNFCHIYLQGEFRHKIFRLTPIYNYQYGTNIEIKVTLPPPSFINVTNTNQLIDNTRNFVQSIVEVELANEEDDKLKNEYTLELFKHYIGTHIDIGAHKDILERCRVSIKNKTNENHSENVNTGEDF